MHQTTCWRYSLSAVLVLLMAQAFASTADTDVLDEIVVTADFRNRAVRELPSSVTVLDADFIAANAVQHFEELVGVVPNLNWSGDGHRARYFQIRGVGELEQYQGAPNPSIGFLIDDIDFSGIGTIATLFDIESVEVLRGSQGSRYGANALGGLIYVSSKSPSAERNGRLEVRAGDDGALGLGMAFGGSLNTAESLLFRISVQKQESDGFRSNRYLGRDDTNGRDESSLRLRLRYQPSSTVDANLSLLYADIDNGYDAFALDNSYEMLSDKPGRDAQKSLGASLRIDWSALDSVTVTSITTLADSDIEFDFDADWGNDDSWAPVTYDYVSLSDRKRRTASQEIRVASDESVSIFSLDSDWVAGLYVQELDDELLTLNQGDYYDPFYDFADSLDDGFGSDYEASNAALFGQLDTSLADSTRLGIGLRIEHRSTRYDDTAGLSLGPSETLWGGELSLTHDHSERRTSFISLSKGYKASGFNLGAVPQGRRAFDEELMWSVEAGMKTSLADNALRLNAAVFYSRRGDQQVRTSFQLVEGDPASFGFATLNVDGGNMFGVEADLRWFPADNWEVYANLGLLEASLGDFPTATAGPSDRGQAHAPRFTLAAGAVYRDSRGYYARLDMSARDEFYFDVSHDQKSSAYQLVHARVGYEGDSWSVQLWGRNLFDKRYAVRGFYFGNEPPDFPATLYTRLGDPRHVGITIEKRFN